MNQQTFEDVVGPPVLPIAGVRAEEFVLVNA